MAVNNKKWTYEAVRKIVEEKGYSLIEFFEPSVENNHKPKIIISNGFENKLMYFDNFKRDKFKFKPNTLESVKNRIEKHYKITLDEIECIHLGKTNYEDLYRLTYQNTTIERTLGSLCHSMKKNSDIFTTRRYEKWSHEDMIDYLKQYTKLSDVRIVYDKGKKKVKNNATVMFVYDKVEFSCRFRTLKDRLDTGDEAILKLDIGETFYKKLLKSKFKIENIGFKRIYKVSLKNNKVTYMCDIYNTETGEVVCGVMTDNLKKRGYWFKTYSGEESIKKELIKHNLNFKCQKTFEDCIYKSRLKFDFYIEDMNILIEYDGEQHFKPIERFGGEIALEKLKIRDKIKEKYCLKNNIKLIRIPYFKYNEIPQIIQDIVSSN